MGRGQPEIGKVKTKNWGEGTHKTQTALLSQGNFHTSRQFSSLWISRKKEGGYNKGKKKTKTEKGSREVENTGWPDGYTQRQTIRRKKKCTCAVSDGLEKNEATIK